MKLIDRKIADKINDMINELTATCGKMLSSETKTKEAKVEEINPSSDHDSRDDAKSRLKLVLMHDRSKLSPAQMEEMRYELIDVISRYVEIDKKALDLCLESETNTIALIANIPILRNK